MEFRLSAPAGPGGSVRSQLQKVWELTGKRPVELVDNDPPAGAEHLWAWWLQLHRRRTAGFSSAAPITWEALAAWSAMSGANPTPWEIGCITALDDLWIETQKKE